MPVVEAGADPEGGDGAIAPYKTRENSFIHHTIRKTTFAI